MPAFTVAQRTAFLTNQIQMGLSAAQRAALSLEGLVTELDFLDFDHDDLQQSFKNTRSHDPAVKSKTRKRDISDSKNLKKLKALCCRLFIQL